MALAPFALSTPERVRAAQGWSASAYPDARLNAKINELSAAIAEVSGRTFGFARFTSDDPLFLAGRGLPSLWLPYPKIRSLTSVAIPNQSLTIRTFSLEGPLNYPDCVFRSERWDAEGRLFLPQGWPRAGVSTWSDTTGHTRFVTTDTPTVSLVGSFGFILPQYDGEADAIHNPEGAVSDLPGDVEAVLGWAIQENLSWKSGNLVREKTAGGREIEYSGTKVKNEERKAELMTKLGGYLNPEALWAG